MTGVALESPTADLPGQDTFALTLALDRACCGMGCGGMLGRYGAKTAFDWPLNGGSNSGAAAGLAGLSVLLPGRTGDACEDASLLGGLLMEDTIGGMTALPTGDPTSLLSAETGAVRVCACASGCGSKKLAGRSVADQEAGAPKLAKEVSAMDGCKTVRP